MNWDIFGLGGSSRLRELRKDMDNTRPCTSWYGHSYKKFDSETLFCPTCGATKKVAA